MILCGASAVQVGTCHWTEGPKCFNRICDELKSIMKQKEYASIDDFRGKLKDWSREGATKSREEKKKRLAKNKISSESACSSNSANTAQLLNMILVVIIAILLADKFGHLSI